MDRRKFLGLLIGTSLTPLLPKDAWVPPAGPTKGKIYWTVKDLVTITGPNPIDYVKFGSKYGPKLVIGSQKEFVETYGAPQKSFSDPSRFFFPDYPIQITRVAEFNGPVG